MALQDAILALNPALYWPCQDTSGTVATDVSGNGRHGTISGTVGLGVAGPEAGTTAFRIYTGGRIQSPALNLAGWATTWSVLFWASSPANGTISGDTQVLWVGDPNNYGARGFRFLQYSPGNGSLNWYFQSSFGSPNVATAFPTSGWHMPFWQRDASVPNAAYSLDAASLATQPNSTTQPPLTSDPLVVWSSFPIVVSHVALFLHTLTQTQLASVTAWVSAWPWQGGSNQPPPSGGGGGPVGLDPADPVVSSQSDLLDKIYAAVHRVYTTPPT